jgi:hypothetical protein
MRVAFLVELVEPSNELIHDFRNFGEDVYRALRDRCPISIGEIDHATSRFTIPNVRRRDIGVVSKTIMRLVQKYRFENTLRVTSVLS